jgi:phosphoribosylformimino-5-aminoimidazole carboxamide ribotide isomerase
MIIIPAVDLMEGRAVRLLQGDPMRRTIFSDDPVQVAREWYRQGAEMLHLVDLDGSFSGAPANRELVQAIVEAISIPVQLGGGIRDLETVAAYLRAGVDRAILGTTAVDNPDMVAEACRRWPGRIAVAIDALKGQVTLRGWTERTALKATDLAKRFEGMGVSVLIYTDVERDGMQRGPNVEATRLLAGSVDIPVIASGGVSSLEDILAIYRIASEGIEGVIVGRALYAGTVRLEEAIRVTKGET